MGIKTIIKSLGVPRTKIFEFSFSIMGGGGGVHGDPRWLMDYLGIASNMVFTFNTYTCTRCVM